MRPSLPTVPPAVLTLDNLRVDFTTHDGEVNAVRGVSAFPQSVTGQMLASVAFDHFGWLGLDQRPIELRGRSAVFSSLADAILVSGPLTGESADQSALRKVREAIPDTPVFANTGVTIDTVRDIMGIADGVIIGTHLKIDGNAWNAVDGARVKRFMDAVAKLT